MNDPLCEYNCAYLCYVCKQSQRQAIRESASPHELSEAWASYLGAPDTEGVKYPIVAVYSNTGEVVTQLTKAPHEPPPFVLLAEHQIISPKEIGLNSPNKMRYMRINT